MPARDLRCEVSSDRRGATWLVAEEASLAAHSRAEIRWDDRPHACSRGLFELTTNFADGTLARIVHEARVRRDE